MADLHLEQIFVKAEIHRQTELIKLHMVYHAIYESDPDLFQEGSSR